MSVVPAQVRAAIDWAIPRASAHRREILEVLARNRIGGKVVEEDEGEETEVTDFSAEGELLTHEVLHEILDGYVSDRAFRSALEDIKRLIPPPNQNDVSKEQLEVLSRHITQRLNDLDSKYKGKVDAMAEKVEKMGDPIKSLREAATETAKGMMDSPVFRKFLLEDARWKEDIVARVNDLRIQVLARPAEGEKCFCGKPAIVRVPSMWWRGSDWKMERSMPVCKDTSHTVPNCVLNVTAHDLPKIRVLREKVERRDIPCFVRGDEKCGRRLVAMLEQEWGKGVARYLEA
jgi:hypothetical protein